MLDSKKIRKNAISQNAFNNNDDGQNDARNEYVRLTSLQYAKTISARMQLATMMMAGTMPGMSM